MTKEFLFIWGNEPIPPGRLGFPMGIRVVAENLQEALKDLNANKHEVTKVFEVDYESDIFLKPLTL